VAPDDLQELNTRVQALLRGKNSILQYYELIGTQYIPPGVQPSPQNAIPTILRNPVIEPYVTPSQCEHLDPPLTGRPSSCVGCHEMARVPSPRCLRGQSQRADFSFLLQNGPFRPGTCEPSGSH